VGSEGLELLHEIEESGMQLRILRFVVVVDAVVGDGVCVRRRREGRTFDV
jgi:hypothetical protein